MEEARHYQSELRTAFRIKMQFQFCQQPISKFNITKKMFQMKHDVLIFNKLK